MAKEPAASTRPVKTTLSPSEIRQGIERFQKRLEELSAFDPGLMTEKQPSDLKALSVAISRSLEKTFGEGTSDFRRFAPAAKLTWSPGFLIVGEPTPLSAYRDGVAGNIKLSKSLLSEAIRTLNEDLKELGTQPPHSADEVGGDIRADTRKVFLVHGRNEAIRETVARFLEKIGFEPVILHERPNKGRTIITKFREEAEGAGFAVVLLTPDDHGGISGGPTTPRARQNVVFELGFFIGALGAERVAAIISDDIEKPSDFDGVVYIRFEGDWRMQLARELKAAGYAVDWNRVMS